jgi:hypothetical protein
MMQCVENAKPGTASSMQDLQHVRDAAIGFRYALQAIPEFSSFGDEVVVRINHQKSGDALVIGRIAHLASFMRIEGLQ